MDKSWIHLERGDVLYVKGCDEFLNFAYTNKSESEKITCPCRKCVNRYYKTRLVVREHIICNGFYVPYTTWTYHGESVEVNEGGSGDPIIGDDMVGMVNDAFGVHYEHGGFNGMQTEESNFEHDDDIKKYFKVLEDAERELYPGCTDYTTLSFVVQLLRIKVLYGLPDAGFDDLLTLLKKAFPMTQNLPNSYYEAKKLKETLGFNYVKYDACSNDCMLYWKDKAKSDSCDICKKPRYKASEVTSDDGTTTFSKVPMKQVRYFPLKPRLQRLFMSSKTASAMRWHDEERVDDGVLRHPADSMAWKTFDMEHTEFSKDSRNVRLGLAADGFNPFRTMSLAHSTWPVVLQIYNFKPSLCSKQPFLILSTLVDGPRAPGNDIDVYMQPLIEELKEFWSHGVRTFDASKVEYFQLRAALLWTINDFPAYANLSGWSTKGKLACPPCNGSTDSRWLKHSRKFCYMGHRRFLEAGHKFWTDKKNFDGTIDLREAPSVISGEDVWEQVRHIENKYGKIEVGEHLSIGKKRKRKSREIIQNEQILNWKKKSIFFELPYWKDNLIRHNLDVMHCEKNIGEGLLNTVLGVPGKSKDNIKSRLDLEEMSLRNDLHPQYKANGQANLPHASFTMSKVDKAKFLSVLKDVKVPDGYSSNISRRINLHEGTISGLKSHDYHILMQQLLPVALRGVLPKNVVKVLIELCTFFRKLCSKTMDQFEFSELEEKIKLTMVHLEKIFPPSFFDVMVHLPIHLAEEARIAGPVVYRWMYHIERYLLTLKKYVRNRNHPEGSIAEGYLIEECLTFCSRYLDDAETKLNRPKRNVDDGHGGRPIGKGKQILMDTIEWEQAHRFILENTASIDPFRDEHLALIRSENPRSTEWEIKKKHNEKFSSWLREHVNLSGSESCISDEVKILSSGPDQWARQFSGCIVNGLRFHTKHRERRRKTQNSGVMVSASQQSYATSSDRRPLTGDVTFYGILTKVIEIRYSNDVKFVIFKCDWVDNKYGLKQDEYKFTLVNFKHLLYKRNLITDEPFILASQAEQVWYMKDPINVDWSVAIRMTPREFFDVPESTNANHSATCPQAEPCSGQDLDDDGPVCWSREDLEGTTLNLPHNDTTIVATEDESSTDEDDYDHNGDYMFDDDVLTDDNEEDDDDDDDFFVD